MPDTWVPGHYGWMWNMFILSLFEVADERDIVSQSCPEDED